MNYQKIYKSNVSLVSLVKNTCRKQLVIIIVILEIFYKMTGESSLLAFSTRISNLRSYNAQSYIYLYLI